MAFAEWEVEFDDSVASDRLAAAIFVSDDTPEARLMATFAAYFDASGDPTHKFIVVSGYIANVNQWKSFDYSWRNAHEHYGVKLPFHAADFFASLETEKYKTQTKARADYVELAKDGRKAAEFLRRLCMAQIMHVNCGISAIIPMEVYNGVSSLLDLVDVIPPYALGARMCIAQVHKWESFFHIQNPIETIFEVGDFGQGKFTDLMLDEEGTIPIYKKKNDFVGLQAADHYAWEQSNLLKRALRPGPLTARDSIVALIHSIPSLHVTTTQANLIGLCEAKHINPRTGVRT